MELIFKLFHIISPLILGVFIAVIYIFKQKKILNLNKISEDIFYTKKEVVAEFCEFFVLNLLLPLFVMESIINQPLSCDDLIILLSGFLCPLFVYLIAKNYSKFINNGFFSLHDNKSFGLIVSTFGGGNRGIILILLIFGASKYLPDILKFFVVFDLGNFLFLVTIIPKLIDSKFISGVRENKSFFLSYPFLIILIIIGFELLSYSNPTIVKLINQKLQATVFERRFLCTLFAFVALTLRSSFKIEDKSNLDIFQFVIVRIFSIIPCFVIYSIFYAFNIFNKQIMAIFIIFLSLPPSSLLPSMFYNAEISTQSRKYITNMTIVLNVFYLFLLPVGFALSFFIQ